MFSFKVCFLGDLETSRHYLLLKSQLLCSENSRKRRLIGSFSAILLYGPTDMGGHGGACACVSEVFIGMGGIVGREGISLSSSFMMMMVMACF